jgi:hypothetical protein
MLGYTGGCSYLHPSPVAGIAVAMVRGNRSSTGLTVTDLDKCLSPQPFPRQNGERESNGF